MAHKYDKALDQIIAEIKRLAGDPEESCRREKARENNQRGNVITYFMMTSWELGELLATIAFACDASHSLRDWEYEISKGRVSAENQYWRRC